MIGRRNHARGLTTASNMKGIVLCLGHGMLPCAFSPLSETLKTNAEGNQMGQSENHTRTDCCIIWKIFLPILFFEFVLGMIFFTVFRGVPYLFLGMSKIRLENWVDAFYLANIISLSSFVCLFAFGRWVPKPLRLPNLMALLRDQAWLKTDSLNSAPHHTEAEKEGTYLEKARSMNMVISILVLISTVLLILNHDLEIKVGGNRAQFGADFFNVIIDMNYFLALLNFLFGLLTAEMLDTAANAFIRIKDRHEGHLKQRFFYHRALLVGGAGYYYTTVGAFSVLALSFFSVLLPIWLPTATFLIASVGASRYFFGYYKDDPSDPDKTILRGEDDARGPGQPWDWLSHLQAYGGGLLAWGLAVPLIRYFFS